MSVVFSGAPNNVQKTSDSFAQKRKSPKSDYKSGSKSGYKSTRSTARRSKAAVAPQPTHVASTDGLGTFSENPGDGVDQDEQVLTAGEDRKRYLGEKASTVIMPTEETATLPNKYLFAESPLIVNLCKSCRMASGRLEMQSVDEDNQILPINMCSICRSTHRALLNTKFMKHSLPCIRRQQLKK